MLQASHIGPAHTAQGLPNQDAVATITSGRWAVVAVADGLGQSGPRSQEAAQMAVDEVIATLTLYLPEGDEDVITWPNAAHAALYEAGRAIERTLWEGQSDQPAATLSCAAVTVDDDEAVVSWASVGDSPIGVVHADGDLEWLTRQIAVNPLTPASPDSLPRHLDHFVYGEAVLTPGDALFCCTEGLAEAILKHPREFVAFFQSAFVAENPQERFRTLVEDPQASQRDRSIVAYGWFGEDISAS